MDLSVVVPTLNSRERLAACLDALAAAEGAETIVVNGPSADGTSGMVRDRGDVDVLVELDDRNVNVARNAGLDHARGAAVAFLDHGLCVAEGWAEAARSALSAGADCVTGPAGERTRGGVTAESAETRTIRGREVTYFDGGNVAFRREALAAIDGFDEYLVVGGARDAAHRLADNDRSVEWVPGMRATRESTSAGVRPTLVADGGEGHDWRWRYRSLAYRLAKNYGVHPTVPYRVARHACSDAWTALREIAVGDGRPSRWAGNSRDVAAGAARGTADGLKARLRDRSPARNPRGWSDRSDRAVQVYDRRGLVVGK